MNINSTLLQTNHLILILHSWEIVNSILHALIGTIQIQLFSYQRTVDIVCLYIYTSDAVIGNESINSKCGDIVLHHALTVGLD